jgi:hypothetical protein
VTIRDAAAYGLILTQGYGTSVPQGVDAGDDPVRTDDGDELFVTYDAARAGVRIENKSDSDPLVILKHFGPGNPDAEPLRSRT